MATHYTCRLSAVPASEGKFRLCYGYLGDAHHIYTIIGPGIVQPPDTEMGREELRKWLVMNYGPKQGYKHRTERTPLSSPLVEANRTLEDLIPRGSVTTTLFWAEDPSGNRALAVEVHNGWDQWIPEFVLAVVWEYENAQPLPGGGVPAVMLGGATMDFMCTDPYDPSILQPGQVLTFVLTGGPLDELRNRGVTMPVENQWIELRTAGYAFDRVAGGTIAAVLADEPE